MKKQKVVCKVVRDGTGWGISDGEALLNEAPMTKAEAKALAAKLNEYHPPATSDDNDSYERGYWGEQA